MALSYPGKVLYTEQHHDKARPGAPTGPTNGARVGEQKKPQYILGRVFFLISLGGRSGTAYAEGPLWAHVR